MLQGLESGLQKGTIFLADAAFTFFHGFPFFSGNSVRNEQEKQLLFKKLVDQKKLEEDNKALRDQFETTDPSPSRLLPAHIIGSPNFIPGITTPETLILDKGSQDNIQIGQAVVYKSNIVGKIEKTSSHISVVLLVTSSNSSFTGYTSQTNALGVVQGKGRGEMIISNVVLSENLKIGDIALTHGDIDAKGMGFPKDLVVGTIITVDKKPSALFQSARIKSALDFSKLSTVFIVLEE